MRVSKENWYDMIGAFNSTPRHLNNLLKIDNIHFERMVHRIYPAKINNANVSDTETDFSNLFIHYDTVYTKNI